MAGPEVISAVLVVLDSAHSDLPLLAFAVTSPEHQGRGVGSALTEKAIERLHAVGISDLHLAVAPTNPARHLYERLSFELVT